jgi:hypothetical protein
MVCNRIRLGQAVLISTVSSKSNPSLTSAGAGLLCGHAIGLTALAVLARFFAGIGTAASKETSRAARVAYPWTSSIFQKKMQYGMCSLDDWLVDSLVVFDC